MSVSPERPAESLSLGLQAAHGPRRRPLSPRGQRHRKDETESAADTRNWFPRIGGSQAAGSQSFFAFASMSRRASRCGFSRRAPAVPVTKNKHLLTNDRIF